MCELGGRAVGSLLHIHRACYVSLGTLAGAPSCLYDIRALTASSIYIPVDLADHVRGKLGSGWL
jgi:hypothetical protein